MDRKILTIALKGTSEQLRNQCCSRMSQRGADMLREDMDARVPVKIERSRSIGAQQGHRRRPPPSSKPTACISLKGTVGEQYVV